MQTDPTDPLGLGCPRPEVLGAVIHDLKDNLKEAGTPGAARLLPIATIWTTVAIKAYLKALKQ